MSMEIYERTMKQLEVYRELEISEYQIKEGKIKDATEIFEKAIGRILAQLQLKREKSDYDDFYIVSKEDVVNVDEEQLRALLYNVAYVTEEGGFILRARFMNG